MRLFLAMLVWLCAISAGAQALVPLESHWKYFKGRTAPPANWNSPGFDDSSWTGGSAPFYYGEPSGGGTLLGDMRNNYITAYLRRSFVVADPDAIDRLVAKVRIDDGFIAWINGVEVARFNVPPGPAIFNSVAQGTIEPTWTTNALPAPSGYLKAGANVLAVHLLNRPITSSDIFFDLALESATDRIPPAISQASPAAGQVSELRALTVRFTEPVQGVSAEDLLVNNQPAESVSGTGDSRTFAFAQPPFGTVDITWAEGHGISDLADPPNSFAGAGWSYLLRDDLPPFLAESLPAQGLAVRSLSQVVLRFSEPVSGVDAADLLIDGSPTSAVQARANNTFAFDFPLAGPGAVAVTFQPGHGIADLAGNPFAAVAWTVTVNPALPVSDVIVSEFLASAESAAGLKDEEGELQDWIELHNRGSDSVRLAGWSLTDDPEEPALWVFPDVSLAAGGRLVVFASGKDRRPTGAGARLHTSFKLAAEGEYLALFNADSPRVPVSEFSDYPVQRNDHSYGLDSSGNLRYFQTPTPGQPNGASSILGVAPKPKANASRGYVETAFDLVLTNELAGASIRYTLDGSPPTAAGGQLYAGPLLIAKTTVLRAAAYREGYLPSEVATFTYIFADQVLRQTNNPPGFPAGPTVMSGYPSDYEMDPEIVHDPAYQADMKAALLALPVLSIAIKPDDMFGAASGIYTHPLNRGPQWEKPCSVEFIPPEGADLQVNCGIQVQGNAAREPIKTPKHPLRITFKGDYGPKSIDYEMFPDSPVAKFDTLILRADFNYSWLHWNPTQRIRAQRTRDAWMKDTMRAMGGLASHNRYAHLYINGVYWGVYDATERPDGSFGEAYLGGGKEDYDVINEGAVVDGTSAAYNAMLSFGPVSTLAQYDAIQAYLDMPQFIDYMLLHFFVGHEDWGNNKNWYTIGPRDGSRGFLYVPWDGEMILGDQGVNRVSASDVPSGLHTKLLASEQYRLDFADRAHKHLLHGGALTPAENIARWMNRAREIELPIIAESARWGDYRRDVHQYQSPPYELYTREDQWRREQARLVNNYFPARTTTVINQLRAAALYPAVAAPVFRQADPGGPVSFAPGTVGTIYYTTNGADPKTRGAAQPAPHAVTYSDPIELAGPARIKARVLSNGAWSALAEAVFGAESLRSPVRIAEIMYNPEPPGEAFEFIELQNFGSLPADLAGHYLEGVDYIFPPNSVIAPGGILLLGSGENPAAFAQRYPTAQVHGRFGGQLVNRGERLALIAPSGQTIVSVDYSDDDPWPEEADGGGHSLEIIDPFGDPDDPANWRASLEMNGSPGRSSPPSILPSVRIDEIMAKSASGPDWVEVFNSGLAPADLSGWILREGGSTNAYRFPAGAVLGGGARLVIFCDNRTEPGHAPFALDDEGETLVLADGAGRAVHRVSSGPLPSGYSLGYVAAQLELCEPTPGGENRAAVLGSAGGVFINEWLADPWPGEPDWLEIYNPQLAPVELRGLFVTLTNRVFEISAPVFVGPGSHLQLFADERPGPNRLDLKLPGGGAALALRTAGGAELATLTYAAQVEGISEGRFPDGAPNIVAFPVSPTPALPNRLGFSATLEASGDALVLRWAARPGLAYRVEISPDLDSWTVLTNLTAAGGRAEAKDAAANSRRYYRVLALP